MLFGDAFNLMLYSVNNQLVTSSFLDQALFGQDIFVDRSGVSHGEYGYIVHVFIPLVHITLFEPF